ncbi:hypothetical protein [Sporosarcina sp. P33]|uniref:hypothetical protein n=1 Tax=Sporosarcina sp. P33 TaxID=1930764 RepID=UPI0009C04096|nr:hypothetical protein [Sporosarcina sp. P33]ARD48832.1 hypothetical protein SporoP33_11760 [Sporosarcina sp. P33]
MFNTSALPGSIALPHSAEMPELKGLFYTAKDAKDETPMYQELNHRLMQLETSTELHEDELNEIEDKSLDLVVAIEAKEEVQLRIDWLKRLYDVKKSLPSVLTVAETERLRTALSSVQTCPLKSELLTELDRLAAALPAEVESPSLSEYDRVMEFAIEQAGEGFINLGKAGREQVVQHLVAKFAEDVSVASIQKEVTKLEQQVDGLAEIDDVQALQDQLEALPLSNYFRLSSERKQMVAEQLIEKRKWKGLASLDRLIHQLDAKLSAAEEQDAVKSMASGVATALNFNQLEGMSIQIR